MKKLMIHTMLILAAVMGLQMIAPAQAGEAKVAHRLPYMTTPCATDDGINCYWDAHKRGNHHGHSFYSMMIGKKVCIQYWDAYYNRSHGRCMNP